MLRWVLVLSCLMTTTALAFNQDGQYDYLPDHIRSWYKSIRAPSGVPCCDVADGHSTEYDIRGKDYWVPIEGTWQKVPPEAVVLNSKNPTGSAVVWYVKQGGTTFYIRCFVPGAEG